MSSTDQQNAVLTKLQVGTRQAIEEASDRISLVGGASLLTANHATNHIYFVESGFVSVTIENPDGMGIEVGVIGREGVLGSWLALGDDVSLFSAIVRSAGHALRLSAAAFRVICDEHGEFRTAVLAQCQRFTSMVAETCHAQARLTVEGRLARWLLLAHDRLDGDTVSITHETLSKMLGVRRPGVTVALHILEGEHTVKSTRGLIKILDRDGLAAVAGSHYRGASNEVAFRPSAL